MDKNDSLTPQEKNDNDKQTVIIPLMVMAVLLIVDLYVMINMPGNYLAIIVVTVPYLVSAYFLGNGILKEIQNNKMRAEEQYEAITKSGKASYILLKKAFEQLEEIEGNSKKPAEDIITAQKAIAKVTISRNKENTDALMNSNDKVLEKIFDIEENLANNQNDLLDKQHDIIDNSMKALMQQQEEIASNMRAMEESIRNELLQAMSSMQTAQLVQPQPVADLGLGDTEPIADIDLGDMDTESALDFDLGESEPIADLDLGENGLDDSLEIGTDLNLGSDLNLGEPAIPADMDLGIELSADEEPVAKETIEEQVVEEPMPAEEEDTAMPDFPDPHKLMTPEEIAALIAKM